MLTTPQAGALIGRSDETIRRYINSGELPAERRGAGRGFLYVSPAAVREVAERFNLPFNEELLEEYLGEKSRQGAD
jgi:hypothetical protein